MKPVGADPNAAPEIDVPLPNDDLAARAPDAAEIADGRWPGQGRRKPRPGSPNGTDTIAETVVNGASFPVDADGRAVVAFSERGIPVDPNDPTSWGSGAGVYLTDGETVVGAVVSPLGKVQMHVFDIGISTWQ